MPPAPRSCKTSSIDYEVYFDAGRLDHRDMIFLVVTGLFFLIGLGMIAFRRRLGMPAFFPLLFFGISTTILLLVIGGTWLGKQTGLPNELRLGRCDVIEGAVADFQPMPSEGGTERFSVGGHGFSYSNPESTSAWGFSESGASGGPIRNGLQVRIHYKDSAIARLEIARDTRAAPH